LESTPPLFLAFGPAVSLIPTSLDNGALAAEAALGGCGAAARPQLNLSGTPGGREAILVQFLSEFVLKAPRRDVSR
jgi:hypothetical protein